MKNLLFSLFLLLFCNNSYSQQGGACIYMLPGDSSIVCTIYGNAGLGSQNSCLNDAIAMGALPIDCLSTPFVGCASFYASNGVGCFYGGTGSCNNGDPCGLLVLPVELVSFEGEASDESNIITWTTASERNSDYFILRVFNEDATTYQMYNIPAHGNSTEIINYQFIHTTPEKRLNYYQLVQYDFDGQFKEYEVISIDNTEENKEIIRKINLLGEEVDEYYKGLVIIHYNDGTIKKVIQ
jgi:hypothetical protein